MPGERRKHRRFQVRDNAFAVINPDPVKLVPVIDVSQGGLGIYVNDVKEWMDKSSKLEIMVADCSFYLGNIPFEIVANFKAFPAHSSNLLEGSRCSLKFGNLMPRQNSRLKYFIRNYTEIGRIPQILRWLDNIMRNRTADKSSKESCDTKIRQGLHHLLLR
jgi:hypothetical protein